MPERAIKVARVYEITLPDDLSDQAFVDMVQDYCSHELDETLRDQWDAEEEPTPENLFELACMVACQAYDQGDLTNYIELRNEGIMTELSYQGWATET